MKLNGRAVVVGGSKPRSLIVTSGNIVPPALGACPDGPRAAIVVTGSELVRGERTDLNGPFLAAQALALGSSRRGSRSSATGPTSSRRRSRAALEADLCLVSGGLGPTHDDRTVELVAKAAGRELVVDEELQSEIGGVSRAVAERLRRPYADFEPGVRKQATLPEGARLARAGRNGAGARARDRAAARSSSCPARRAELQRLWPRALETEPVRRVLARAQPPGRRVLRFYGASESAVAKALADAGGDGDGVEATICARDFEIHVDLLVEPGAEERADGARAGARGAARAVPVRAGRARRSRSSCSISAAPGAGRWRRPSRAPAASWRRG